MFALLKKLVFKFVTVLKVAVGVAVGAVVLCGFLQLFALGSTAGVAVTATCWVAQNVTPVVLGAASSLLQSAEAVGTAAGILLALLLLGLARLTTNMAEALAEPVVSGYRAIRPAHPPARA